MLYATNGRPQDLPPNQAFDFWSQVDWGIAYNIAKVEQNLLVGADRAPHQQLAIDLLLDAVMRDEWSVWKSRPRGQQINWEGWGNFCSYYLRSDIFAQQAMLGEMIRGYVGSWLPKFLASRTEAAGAWCFKRKAESIVFWDFHEFDLSKCRSIRQLPPTFPTPHEIAMGKAYAEWWASLLGTNEAQKMMSSPPTPAQRAQAPSRPPQPNPPNLLLPDEDEDAEARCEEGYRWNAATQECEPSGARMAIDLSKVTPEALEQTGSPFKTVAELKAAMEGPYRDDVCDWYRQMGVITRAEIDALLAQDESIYDLVGHEEKERAAISQWVVEAQKAWPKLNAAAQERYVNCFYDGLYHPPKKQSWFWDTPLPAVAGIWLLGLGAWYFTRRG